jgi:hypothetical protein
MAIRNPIINEAEGTLTETASGGVLASPLAGIIVRLWRTMVILGGLLVLIFLIWGAFDWLSSGGNEKKLEGAKTKMTNAVIGLVILAASWAAVGILSYVTGFDLLNIIWPVAE